MTATTTFYERIFRDSSLNSAGGGSSSSSSSTSDRLLDLSLNLTQYTPSVPFTVNIPNIAYLFSTFDPLNGFPFGKMQHDSIDNSDWDMINSSLPIPTNEDSLPLAEFIHVREYLECLSFRKDSLKVTTHDAVFYAIVSFMLRWTSKALEKFSAYSSLANFIAQERRSSINGTSGSVFKLTISPDIIIPYSLATFRIYRQYFDSLDESLFSAAAAAAVIEPKPKFNLFEILCPKFISELRDLYSALRAHAIGTKPGWSSEELTYLQTYLPPPFQLDEQQQHSDASKRIVIEPVRQYYDQYGNNASIKYITGQACVGKSSLIRHLTKGKYNLISRGDLGGFTAKSHCPLSVSGLYYSLNWALRHKNIIGDRGCFDNNVWRAIQEYVDPRYEDTLVDNLLDFFANWLNIPIINSAREERVIIIIDPYIHNCRERMLRRASDGDLLRARIKNYNIVQIMAYYIGARLFSWPVVCVPYTDTKTGIIDDAAYASIARESELFFEHNHDQCKWLRYAKKNWPQSLTNTQNILSSVGQQQQQQQQQLKFDRPIEAFRVNYKYAKQRSIYK